jgi:hypothetical protein
MKLSFKKVQGISKGNMSWIAGETHSLFYLADLKFVNLSKLSKFIYKFRLIVKNHSGMYGDLDQVIQDWNGQNNYLCWKVFKTI